MFQSYEKEKKNRRAKEQGNQQLNSRLLSIAKREKKDHKRDAISNGRGGE